MFSSKAYGLRSTSFRTRNLKSLRFSLPMVALRSKAPSTVKKYSGAFCRWKRWVQNKPEVSAFPATPLHVALYLSFLIQKAASSAPIQEAVNAMSWCHQLAVVDDPMQHPLVKNILASSKRILAKQPKKSLLRQKFWHRL